MTKLNNKYYLQYAAPGTEFSGYADGVAVSDNTLGSFTNQSDPFCFKTGGFVHGSKHGSTFKDNNDNDWHISNCVILEKHGFERRLSIWLAVFDKDDVMICNTAFGDYPQYLPKPATTETKMAISSKKKNITIRPWLDVAEL